MPVAEDVAEALREHPEWAHLRTSAFWPYHVWRERNSTGPSIKQLAFLIPVWIREMLYGGAVGGGKSDALLLGALQYVEESDYRALILRRTFKRLELELIPRSKEWLLPLGARYDEVDHRWTFPSGATLTFGHLQRLDDVYNYQGTAYHYIGFDELTEFDEEQYRYFFSRQRRIVGSSIPLRMRATANPVGTGKAWVKARWRISDTDPRSGIPGQRVFIKAALDDNPYLIQEEYVAGLRELGEVNFQRLRWGLWDIQEEGNKFQRWMFDQRIKRSDLPPNLALCRFWDLAATEEPKKVPGKKRDSSDPDYTVGLLLGRDRARVYVIDVRRGRWSDADVEKTIKSTAEYDSRTIPVRMEQEGGAAGKSLIGHYRREVLAGWNFGGIPSTGDKEVRAAPLAARAQFAELVLVEADWNERYVDEMVAFPHGAHDDQVDASSGAYAFLTGKTGAAVKVPPGMKRVSPHRIG